MAVKEKAKNYSDAEVAALRSGYTGADNKAEVSKLAAQLGKTPQSVRAKLSNMGIYVKEEAVKAEKGANKMALAEAIGSEVGLKEHEVEGLAKATKSALEKVLSALTNG